jgi:hypothetical protein
MKEFHNVNNACNRQPSVASGVFCRGSARDVHTERVRKVGRNSLRDCKASLLAAIFLLTSNGCVIWPHSTSHYEVRGTIFDNVSLVPIPGAEVAVHFPQTSEKLSTNTRQDGSFSIRSDGQWNWILYFWDDDEGPDAPVEMTLKHPLYEKEKVSDLTCPENKDGRFLDVGSLYMDRKR